MVPEPERDRGGAWLPAPLVAALALAIALGVVIRFVGLDRKPRSFDETYTGFRIAAVERGESRAILRGPAPPEARDLLALQAPRPGRGVAVVAGSLEVAEPHHGPAYFVGAYLWALVFGAGTGSLRALAALLSALGLPALYLCARDLLGSHRAGLTALALGSLSPMLVAFSQDARSHGPGLAVFAWATWALIRAVLGGGAARWCAYAALLAAAAYTYPAVLLGAPAHAAYAALAPAPGRRRAAVVVAWAISAAAALALFAPWCLNLWERRAQAEGMLAWKLEEITPAGLYRSWAWTAARLRLDLGDTPAGLLVYALGTMGLAPVVAGAASLLKRRPPAALALALGLLAAIAPSAVLDLLLGGQRSTTPRHFVVALLGAELLAAAGIDALLSATGRAARAAGVLALAAALVAGAVSAVTFAGAGWWWTLAGGPGPTVLLRAVGREPRSAVVIGKEAPHVDGIVFAAAHGLPPTTLIVDLRAEGRAPLPEGVERAVLLGVAPEAEKACEAAGLRPAGTARVGGLRVVAFDRRAKKPEPGVGKPVRPPPPQPR